VLTPVAERVEVMRGVVAIVVAVAIALSSSKRDVLNGQSRSV
jgi:hypothetical protein